MMEAIGVDSFYNNKWGAMGAEIVKIRLAVPIATTRRR